MRSTWMEAVGSILSGEAAKGHTEDLTAFYRSPGSSGYHEATDYVQRKLREIGLDDIVVDRYPLDGETQFLGQVMPPAWEPVEAELRLLPDREVLAAYPQIPSCLPWWSPSTPGQGVEVEIVDVGPGLHEADYGGKDVAGKAVLVRNGKEREAWTQAVELARRHGAQGIISDFLLFETPPWRTREALPHAVQLLRLPPRFDNPWGIIVGYQEAEAIAARCRQGTTRVFVRIITKLFEGEGQNLIATIRGVEFPEESVFLVGHTSAGTRPGANCAAGPALMLEIARTLTTLIAAGTIPPPRRSIRFLFVAEGLGSVAFFAQHAAELPDVLAGLCFDSVGHSQSKLRSSLVFYRVPDSVPSYLNDLAQWLWDHLPKDANWPFKEERIVPLLSFASLPYTPWSDNQRWNGVGIPMPLLMSWPDLYFHTQLLTADCTDPQVFHRSGHLATLLLLTVANGGLREAEQLARLLGAYGQLRVQTYVERVLAGHTTSGASASLDLAIAQVRYLAARDAQNIESTRQLVRRESETVREGHDRMVKSTVGALWRRAHEALRLLKPRPGPAPRPSRARRPVRRVLAPPPRNQGLSYTEQITLFQSMRGVDARASLETLKIVGDEMWNLANGERTLGEIAAIIGFEFGLVVNERDLTILADAFVNEGYLGWQ